MHAQQQSQPIVLELEIMRLIDGTSFGVTGHKIKFMLHILLKLDAMLHGEQDSKGNKRGIYLFEGKPVSIHELSLLEVRHENDQHKKAAFKKLLADIKQDFDTKITPFMKDAHGAKAQLLMLIKQSCEQRGRGDSFLLTWGKAEEGHETDALHNDVLTFHALETFCLDLTNFLKDMINSCPKAVAHYKELKAQYAAAHKGIEHEHQG